MSDLLKFAGDHPVLTCIILVIVGQTIIYTAAAIRGKYKPD